MAKTALPRSLDGLEELIARLNPYTSGQVNDMDLYIRPPNPDDPNGHSGKPDRVGTRRRLSRRMEFQRVAAEDLQVHWLTLVTLIPLACITCSALGLTFGTIFDPRNVPLMFGIVILPLTFLGGTYYAWTTLEPVKAEGLPWLQYVVLINPLVYINEGSRAALTSSNHMTLWAVYPALVGFSALFLWVGTRNSPRRVIS